MPISILHIMQSLEVGGMENGVVNIVNSIDERYDSIVYCTKAKGALADKLTHKSKVYFDGSETGILKATWKLLKYCLKSKPDIIHTHGWGTLISGYIVSKILSIKLIHGEHGVTYFERKKDVIVQKYMLSRTDMNLFVSKTLAVDFVKNLQFTSNIKNTVLYNGVDTDRFKKRKIEISDYVPSVTGGALIIGTIGRLVPVKNHLWLIDVLGELLGDSVKLIIVGGGELEDELKQKIQEKNLQEDVFLPGESSQPEMLMNCFDIFVLPSLTEGLSNTVLEAMATSLPVVASNVGGNSELVADNENGFLYESGDSEDFYNKVKILTNDKEKRKDFSEKSLSIVESKFMLATMIKNYEVVYDKVMK